MVFNVHRNQKAYNSGGLYNYDDDVGLHVLGSRVDIFIQLFFFFFLFLCSFVRGQAILNWCVIFRKHLLSSE